jgi:SAM-dependent methyltransferase
VDDGAADVVLSIFGVIFAREPAAALREIARILRPDGRAFVTAWVPAGPIDAMLAAMGRIMARVAPGPPPSRFAWFRSRCARPLAHDCGLVLAATEPRELTIRAASPEGLRGGRARAPDGAGHDAGARSRGRGGRGPRWRWSRSSATPTRTAPASSFHSTPYGHSTELTRAG